MIGGFIVQGSGPKRVIVRAIGPELTQFGIPDALANPRLELHNGSGALIATNDDWQTTILGGVITPTSSAMFKTVATLRLRQANQRSLQTCNRAATPPSCVV
jgi:hypothetical protein